MKAEWWTLHEAISFLLDRDPNPPRTVAQVRRSPNGPAPDKAYSELSELLRRARAKDGKWPLFVRDRAAANGVIEWANRNGIAIPPPLLQARSSVQEHSSFTAAESARPVSRPGKRKGDGSYERADEPALQAMRILINQGKAESRREAATKVVAAKEITVTAISDDAAVDRLSRRYKTRFGEKSA
jgi:hypothetical protein